MNNFKKVVVKGAREVIVEVVDGIVKIIVGDDSATSDGQAHPEFSAAFSIYVEIDESVNQINFITDGKIFIRKNNQMF